LVLGPSWVHPDLVFTTRFGTPLLRPNFVRRAYKPLLAKAGLPHTRPHDLWHTAATLLLRQGVSIKVVSYHVVLERCRILQPASECGRHSAGQTTPSRGQAARRERA
jgi:integrase